MELRKLSEIKPNPLNTDLYAATDEESAVFLELVASIKANGILQPLVLKADLTLLSGHRRWRAAQVAGLLEAPIEWAPPGDERQLLIEYNRYRVKTPSELMREAELLEVVIREKNAARIGAAGHGSSQPWTREEVATKIGLKRSNYEKIKRVFNAAKTDSKAALIMERLDKGEITVEKAFVGVKCLSGPSKHEGVEEPEFIKHYNWMTFPTCDPRFGIDYPGRKPGQLVGNLIWMYTEEGDLVVDPMAGGGTTLDIAKFLGRECLVYDIKPSRPDISQHDISTGFPKEARDAQFIYMDPPYWNVVDYNDEGASSLGLEAFIEWYKKLIQDASRTVRVGGFVAVINMAQYFRLPADFPDGYVDWPILTYQWMQEARLRPWNRIASTEPVTSFTGFDMERAKEGKYVLPILYDTVVMRRVD